MSILVLHSKGDEYTARIVATALVRSFSTAQVSLSTYTGGGTRTSALVLINPPAEADPLLAGVLARGGKALVLGRLSPAIARRLGLECGPTKKLDAAWGTTRVDHQVHHNASPATVRYSQAHELGRASVLQDRPLCRFDFLNEWNNLGFGRILLDGGPWSLAGRVRAAEAMSIARVISDDGEALSDYAAISETPAGAALWINRPVGPVDSLEWRVVEAFFGDYRADDLPCLPYLAEIPAGYAGAVTMRLDCDESVKTARPLLELYAREEIPLSLAVLTGQPIELADINLLNDAVAAGGSVVSHSVHHYPSWGGSYEAAHREAGESKAWLEQHVPRAGTVQHAVSPFHQNPSFAVDALADAGYTGFIGGIIANDPEYLLGRAGRVPFVGKPIVSHSAQCMLHGDCHRRYGQSTDVYRQSFDNHFKAGSIFGYLDHPFSERYQYGWSSEAERLEAHRELIEHMRGRPNIWWANLNDVLGFLRKRDAARISVSPTGELVCESGEQTANLDQATFARLPNVALRWKGQDFAAA